MSEILTIRSDDRICISGLPRSGKTVFMRYLLTLADPQIYIIDPLNQFEQFGEVGDIATGAKRMIPQHETPEELEEVCRKLWRIPDTTLAVEEMEQYIVQGKSIGAYTSGLIRMGRNWGVGIWGTTRRIQDINKRFFDLCQHCFFFRSGFKSREYIAGMIGSEYVWPQGNTYNKTGLTLTTLPPFHCIHYDLENETARIITLDMSAGGQVRQVGQTSESSHEINQDEEETTDADIDKSTKR